MGEAIQVTRHGGPEVLERVEQAPTEPGPGQVRVRVEAAGVNFIDVYFRTGVYPMRTPFVPGVEGAGVVEAVGDGVGWLQPGQRVAWAQVTGSYATHVVGPADRVVAIPDGVDTELAGAVLLQGMTAHYLVHAVRTPARGDTALVHAAAGGTGLLLVQLLARAGVRVIGTCSTAAKAALATEAGADAIIRYDEEDFTARARELTGGQGVDVVYDSVGQSTFDGSLASLRPRGLLCLFGQSSGAVPAFDPQRLNRGGSLFVTRPSLAHYVATRAELEQRAAAVLDAVARGQLWVRVGARFPLGRAADAHRALEGRQTTGKVLLNVT